MPHRVSRVEVARAAMAAIKDELRHQSGQWVLQVIALAMFACIAQSDEQSRKHPHIPFIVSLNATLFRVDSLRPLNAAQTTGTHRKMQSCVFPVRSNTC
jgi:hypothetical protein